MTIRKLIEAAVQAPARQIEVTFTKGMSIITVKVRK